MSAPRGPLSRRFPSPPLTSCWSAGFVRWLSCAAGVSTHKVLFFAGMGGVRLEKTAPCPIRQARGFFFSPDLHQVTPLSTSGAARVLVLKTEMNLLQGSPLLSVEYAEGIRQSRFIMKPRVARDELPWVSVENKNTAKPFHPEAQGCEGRVTLGFREE